MRKAFIAANWKMNNNAAAAEDFMKGLGLLLENDDTLFRAVGTKKIQIAVFPPFLSIPAAMAAKTDPLLVIGAQNCHCDKKGAFTGEISVDMLKETGITHVIIGHSERRHIFGENDEFLNKKLHAATEAGLIPVYCVGETDEERVSGKTLEIIKEQLTAGLKDISVTADKIIIAYEPVWAIGTGKTATPNDAQKICLFIREALKEIYGAEFADEVRIIYGGSVNSENTEDIMIQPDIDGVLVGGASLKYASFAEIAKAAAR